MFVLIKGHLINLVTPNIFNVDLVAIITAFLLVFYGQTGAGIFAFGQGLLIDAFSVGLPGLFTFLYLIIFLGINIGSRLLDLGSVMGQIIIISLAVLLKKVLFVVFLDLFSLETTVTSSVFLAFSISALCSGLIAPFIFTFFNQINHFLIGFVRKTL